MSYSMITRQLTPLFNTPHFGKEFQNIQLDAQGLWRPLETLLTKGVPISIEGEIDTTGACKISSPAYPSSTPIYTHYLFLKGSSKPIDEWKEPPLPPLSVFLSRINQCVRKKVPYLWGGNAPDGTPGLWNLYFKPARSLKKLSCVEALKGVDCSGLIYWASRGATPRNTSALISEGSPVKVRGLSNDILISKLKSGMLIAWKGHVLIVTQKGIVDSVPEEGVRLRPTLETIDEIRKTRIPVDEWPSKEECPDQLCFVVRDLYPHRERTEDSRRD